MLAALDSKINALSPTIAVGLRTELASALRTLRQGQNPVGVLLAMSRLSLRLLAEMFTHLGHRLPSDNLYDCIVTAARGDPQQRLAGLHFLPDEMASYLHTLRILSNKADHAAEKVALQIADAENALNIFLRVLEWFYCESADGPQLPGIYVIPGPAVPHDTPVVRRWRGWGIRLRLRTLAYLGVAALLGCTFYMLFPYVYVIRAQRLWQQARHDAEIKQAGDAYQAAVEHLRGGFWAPQRAAAFNRLGRAYAVRRYAGYALHWYREAIAAHPPLAEAYANQAFLLEEGGEQEAYLSARTGKFDDALALYQQALGRQPGDHLTKALQAGVARRRSMALQRAQVEDWLAMPQSCQTPPHAADSWTSTSLTLAWHLAAPRQDILAQRAGTGEVLMQRLAQRLHENPRLVMREATLERGCLTVHLLAVYRIQRSASLEDQPQGALHVQVLATDTAQPRASAQVVWSSEQLDGIAENLAGQLWQQIQRAYPLRGRIIAVTPEGMLELNIGTTQGVTPGLFMQLLAPTGPVGLIEVVQAESQYARARVRGQTVSGAVQTTWKVQEVAQP